MMVMVIMADDDESGDEGEDEGEDESREVLKALQGRLRAASIMWSPCS